MIYKKFIKDINAMKKFRSDKVKNNWVFALFYTATLKSTAARFGVEENFLSPVYEEFWKEFAGVKIWQDKLIKQYEELGYVQMFDGLRRRAPLGRGQIVNTPVQGATNRIMMDAMNRLSETENWLLQPIMQIHDDLVFSFDSEREFEDSAPIILDFMLDGSAFDWFCVPLSVEIKVGPTWADMVEIGNFSSDKRIGWPKRAKEFM